MKSVNVPRKSSNLLKRRLKIAEIVAAQVVKSKLMTYLRNLVSLA